MEPISRPSTSALTQRQQDIGTKELLIAAINSLTDKVAHLEESLTKKINRLTKMRNNSHHEDVTLEDSDSTITDSSSCDERPIKEEIDIGSEPTEASAFSLFPDKVGGLTSKLFYSRAKITTLYFLFGYSLCQQ